MNVQEYTSYMRDIVVSTVKGMTVTWKVFSRVVRKGAITIEYPENKDAIPMGSRGLLFNDVADCISCRQCAVACPVNCIYIEAEKKEAGAPVEMTSGGVKKTLALKHFAIDVSLCCYCGLCSAACPTDCLYHTKEYEYSKYDRDKFTFNYLDFKH